MPSTRFVSARLARLARISRSVICSISPAPNTGVGMRKITLRFASAFAKSGWRTPQPGASERPAIVKSACTPPSGLPSRLRTKRASRIGPFALRNGGMVFVALSLAANAICGFTAGLLPPNEGCWWHPPQLSRFRVGPSPSSVPSASLNCSLLASNAASSSAVVPGRGAPAPAGAARGPGSRAFERKPSGRSAAIVLVVGGEGSAATVWLWLADACAGTAASSLPLPLHAVMHAGSSAANKHLMFMVTPARWTRARHDS